MNKIILKTYELIDTLEDSSIIKELTLSKNKLLNNKKILLLIDKINNSRDNEKRKLKKELFKNKDYKNYIDNYNKLYYIVLDINNRLKKLTNTKELK